MDENNAISVVENLIETNKDGQKGYQDAAAHVKRADLKTYFNEQSLERSRFAGELEAELVRLGKPDKKVSGSASAAMHRAWIDTKVALGGGDKSILESVEKGEDNAKGWVLRPSLSFDPQFHDASLRESRVGGFATRSQGECGRVFLK